MAQVFTLIPALNAAVSLDAVFESLVEGERTGLSGGWVLADGGSNDGTLDIARRAGAQTLSGPRGRGPQLAAAAQAASGLASPDDWYLFLHADTRVEPGWTGAVRRFIDQHQDRDCAGFFRFCLSDTGAKARRLERAVALRCTLLSLPYGDQGLLISRRFYEALGGFKPWPLFEDVDLVRRIGRNRLKPINARAVTSAERFLSEGYTRRSARNLALLGRYFLGADPHALARAYRR